MATPAQAIPDLAAGDQGGFNAIGANQADRMGLRSGRSVAQEVAEAHRKHLQARRYRDLTAEKYLMHIDGEGDAQWADILFGNRVAIPQHLHPYRVSENLLRPVSDNAVAYHTTQPFQFLADAKQDRESRERAKIDTAFANHFSRTQRLNALAGQGFYLSIAAGFAPLHAYWRDDLASDPYEPLYLQDYEGFRPRPGIIDAWVGNPFDHSFNPGAKRGSIQAQWYGRVLPVSIVANSFEEVLNQQGVTLHGDTTTPSASVFQRLARSWYFAGTNAHGTAAMLGAETSEEELIALVCREIAPGIDPQYPEGRLVVVALQGTTSTRQGRGRHTAASEAILLADQPLPGGEFSAEIIYSHHRFDDVHGKPWIADLDTLQVQLNLGLSHQREYIERGIRAPTIVGGQLVEDTAEYDGYSLLEMEPGVSTFPPHVMEIPNGPAQRLEAWIDSRREAIFRLGGYQAASRGESHAGDPAAKVIALARADDTIHGPVNVVFRNSMESFVGKAWSLMKQYGDVGWVIDVVGEDYAHLADGYIDRTRLSDSRPNYRMVSMAGATPEAHAQQLMGLVTTRGADGTPLMTTEEFRRKWPNQNLYDDTINPGVVRRRRAATVASRIRDFVRDFREQTGLQESDPQHPWVQQAALQIMQVVMQRFPPLPDDDINAHIEALSELTQDETEDPLARLTAQYRQEQYFMWAAQTMGMGAAPPGPGGQPHPQQGAQQAAPRGGGSQQPAQTHPAGGTVTSEAFNPARLHQSVGALTEQASIGGVQ